MAKDLSVSDWVEEIERGLEFRKIYGLEDHWLDIEALFYNTHPSSRTGPNIVVSTGDSLLSHLSVPNPRILVKPRKRERLLSARVLESIDNDLLEDLAIDEEIEIACLHAFLWGKGILKLGFDSEFGWSLENDIGEGEALGMSITQFDKKGRRIEFSERVRPGMPWVKACLPHDIVVPYGTRKIEDSPYVVHRVIRHIDAIRADDKYEHTRGLQPVMSMEDYVKSYQTTIKPYRIGEGETRSRYGRGKVEYCELWEIHDRRTGRIKVIATGYDKFLRNEEDMLQLPGLPFVDLSFVPNARNFWTTPDGYYLQWHQADLSDIALQTEKNRRLMVLKFLFNEDVITEEEMQRALSADVGVGIKIDPQGGSIRDAIQTISIPNYNQGLYLDAEYVRRAAREVVGFSRNQMGEFESSGRRTATEAMTVREAAGLRMSRRQKIISTCYRRVFEKLNSIIFEYWTAPRWVQVGPEDNPAWYLVRGHELKGDYKYSVSFSVDPAPSLQARRQQALQLYAILGQDPRVNQQKLQEYLKAAFNDPELDSVFQGVGNASLPVQMPGMQQGGGSLQANQEQGKLPSVLR